MINVLDKSAENLEWKSHLSASQCTFSSSHLLEGQLENIRMALSCILSLKASLDFGGHLRTAQQRMDVYGLSQVAIVSVFIDASVEKTYLL